MSSPSSSTKSIRRERKRVHFPSTPVTKVNTYNAQDRIPRTPSPVYSSSDESASEAGPSTPPTASLAQLYMTPRAKPAPLPTPSTTHPFLETDAYMRAAPLCWDVRLPPSTATVRPTPDKYKPKRSPLPNQRLEAAELALPATYPPTTRMDVAIPQLPWKPMTITSKSKRDTLVSFSDLLSDVHSSLQTVVRKEEFDSIPKDAQQNIARAFYKRCERFGQSRVEERLGRKFDRFSREDVGEAEAVTKAEEQKGVKRVDFLLASTEFFGLALAPDVQNDSDGRPLWVLSFAPPRS
ncbi:hypothetical protein SCHPADRAFT_908568 [Schizopora paradoxa]|uniref:DUF6699 domain-containing protein n=1 Tax=Schizopora paradoxa TaxID=27342 RepID=A0A0H2RUL2_9AGAM|nr:hypothetical protein SCHPADRAFT_908568 [Schizopora paradoxa]